MERRNTKRGIATLWTILTLGLMVLLVCYVVEAGRLFLARQQLIISLESAAMAAAKDWCQTVPEDGTGPSRDVALDFAAANPVLGQPVILSPNFAGGSPPGENASCDGDLVFGSISKTSPEVVFDAGIPAGCGLKDGPNAIAPSRISINDWQTVTLCGRDYECMIVVATPEYDSGSPPSVVRIRNATGNSFEFFVQDVNSGAPVPDVPVNFIVVEAGVYTEAADGITMEAVKYDSTVTDQNNSWVGEARAYNNAYTTPVVVGQVMTYNDPDWSVFWSHGGDRRLPATAAGLFTGKHVGEDPDATRADEMIGYIVFEEGAGHINGLPVYAGQTPDVVQGITTAGHFDPLPAGSPCTSAVASQTGMAGANGSWTLLDGPDPLTSTDIHLILDEDQNQDNERNHTTEFVNYVTFGGPCAVLAQASIDVPWLCESFLGCPLPQTTLTAEVMVYHDCDGDCTRLICVDQFICP